MSYYIKKHQLCLECQYQDFTMINGFPKCYWTCPYRLKEKK